MNGQRLASRHIVIATGALLLVPTLPGLEQVPWLTSYTLWQLRTAPRQLLVLGGGPIGCELAQSFALLGVPVTLVELSDQLLPREEREVAALLAEQLARDGVRVLTGWRAERADYLPAAEGDLPIRLQLRRGDETQTVAGDQLLLALGRVANVSGFGLEALGWS